MDPPRPARAPDHEGGGVPGQRDERLRLAFDFAPIGIALVDPEGRWVQVNRSFCELIGFGEQELVGRPVQTFNHPDDIAAEEAAIRRMLAGESDTHRMDKRFVHADGQSVWVALSVALVRDVDDAPRYFIVQVQDVSERKRREHELAHRADHDALTGLFNRHRGEQELQRQLDHAARYGTGGAVLLIDLDDFKAINDRLGHHAGDETLRQVAGVLRSRARATDVLARLGGDEFLCVLPRTSAEDASVLARDVRRALRENVVVDGRPPGPSASIGVASVDPGDRTSEVLRRADAAMYAAKRAGRGDEPG